MYGDIELEVTGEATGKATREAAEDAAKKTAGDTQSIPTFEATLRVTGAAATGEVEVFDREAFRILEYLGSPCLARAPRRLVVEVRTVPAAKSGASLSRSLASHSSSNDGIGPASVVSVTHSFSPSFRSILRVSTTALSSPQSETAPEPSRHIAKAGLSVGCLSGFHLRAI